MPRDTGGIYTLPGQTYVPGTIILSSDMNQKFADLTTAITQSLSRTGDGNMLAPMRVPSGSAANPTLSWSSDPQTGFFLNAPGDVRLVSAGAIIEQWTLTAVSINRPLTVTGNTSIAGSLSTTGNFTVDGNSTLGNAPTDTTTISGPTTVNGNLQVALGGEELLLKPGTMDHAYMGFYARTSNPAIRSAYIGFGGSGSTVLDINNSLTGGNITLTPGASGIITVGSRIAVGGGNPASSTAFSNTIAPTNIPKAHAKVAASTGTLLGGFNLTVAISGNNLRFTFPVGGTMLDANYTIMLSSTGAAYGLAVVAQTTSTFDVGVFEAVITGGGTTISDTQRSISGWGGVVHVTVFGNQ